MLTDFITIGYAANVVFKLAVYNVYWIKMTFFQNSKDSVQPKQNRNISPRAFGRIIEKVYYLLHPDQRIIYCL